MSLLSVIVRGSVVDILKHCIFNSEAVYCRSVTERGCSIQCGYRGDTQTFFQTCFPTIRCDPYMLVFLPRNIMTYFQTFITFVSLYSIENVQLLSVFPPEDFTTTSIHDESSLSRTYLKHTSWKIP